MTIETLREICLALPDATEDVKWGADLAFCVGGRMFCVAYLEPPHMTSFKCTPEEFSELSERPGLRPAPYLARAMWIQEEELGATLERHELERLVRTSYALVRAKLPKKQIKTKISGARRSRSVPSRKRRRRR